jgi:hypothetical protein
MYGRHTTRSIYDLSVRTEVGRRLVHRNNPDDEYSDWTVLGAVSDCLVSCFLVL